MANGFPENFLFVIAKTRRQRKRFAQWAARNGKPCFSGPGRRTRKEDLRRLADCLAASVEEHPQAF